MIIVKSFDFVLLRCFVKRTHELYTMPYSGNGESHTNFSKRVTELYEQSRMPISELQIRKISEMKLNREN